MEGSGHGIAEGASQVQGLARDESRDALSATAVLPKQELRGTALSPWEAPGKQRSLTLNMLWAAMEK